MSLSKWYQMVCQFFCINLNLDVNAIQPYYTLTYTSPVCTYYLPVYLPFFINLKESKESITSSRIVYFSKSLIESAEHNNINVLRISLLTCAKLAIRKGRICISNVKCEIVFSNRYNKSSYLDNSSHVYVLLTRTLYIWLTTLHAPYMLLRRSCLHEE